MSNAMRCLMDASVQASLEPSEYENVRVWTFFTDHVLRVDKPASHLRKLLDQQGEEPSNFSAQAMEAVLRKMKVSKYLPSGKWFKRTSFLKKLGRYFYWCCSQEYWLVRTSKDFGLAIQWKENVTLTLEKLNRAIPGWLTNELSDEAHQLLLENNYPSIYRKTILYGPLSLANHGCISMLKFAEPKGRVLGLAAIDAKDKKFVFEKNKPFFIEYGYSRKDLQNMGCKCGACWYKQAGYTYEEYEKRFN